MILPDPLQRYGEYYKFYAKMRLGRMIPKFLMLDNGAFENGGEPLDGQRLLGLATLLQADEIVIPDRMGDMHTTKSLFSDWVSIYEHLMPNYQWAAVVHGQTMDEMFLYAKWLCDQRGIQTVCLPKILVDVEPSARAQLAEFIHDERPGMKIHFLGINNKAPTDWASVRNIVRSCDTSLAYVAGINKVKLDWTLDWRKLSSRPDSYWTYRVTDEQQEFIEYNLQVMRQWVG